MSIGTLAIILVIIWLVLNLWYIGITPNDFIDWLFLRGIDIRKRE